jgi:predicted NACHT family NTPase
MTDPSLDTALTRWEEAHTAGQDLSPAELLPDRPELHAVVGQLIARMRAAAEARRSRFQPWLVGFLVMALLITIFLGLAGIWYYAALARAQVEAAEVAEKEARAAEAEARRQAALAQPLREQIAEHQRQAEENVRQAREELRRLEQVRYAAQLARAQQEWEQGNARKVKGLLDEVDPAFRDGWEWRYLTALLQKPAQALQGHTSPVLSVAFTPDGKRLASGSADGTVRLWDPATGKEALKFDAHKGKVLGLCFAPDGTILATAGDDKEAKLWDLTGQLRWTLKVDGGVRCIAYSPAAKTVAVGSDKGEIHLIDTGKEESLNVLRGHTAGVACVCFSPDGKRIASAGNDKTVRIWDAATGQELLTLKGHTEALLGLAFSPDAKTIASASADARIKLWDAARGQEKATLQGHTKEVHAVYFSPDGKTIASAGGDGRIKLWDVAAGQESLTLKGHTGAVLTLAFSPDGAVLASGGEDKSVRLWEATKPGQ